jgi:hypothetical protein
MSVLRQAMRTPPDVAVILLNHADYAQRYLVPCYESLRRQTYPRDRFDVFIVSNGVSEETRRFIRRAAPGARLLDNPRNLGWSGGNNRAIRVALAEGTEYVILLNIDTVAEPDWLERLLDDARRRPELHILQSKILLDGTGRINSLGNRIQYLGYGYCNGYGQEDRRPSPPMPVDYASGAAMLVRRQVFERVGLFWDQYHIYYDDVEFCWRARLAGFNVGFAESSVCHHRYDFRVRMDRLYHFQRNRLLTLLTLARVPTLLLIAPCLVVSEAVVALYLVSRGWGAAVWGVLKDFLRRDTWRLIRARRRDVGGLRVRRDAEIVGGFAAEIVFREVDHPLLRYVANPLLRLYWMLAKRLLRW